MILRIRTKKGIYCKSAQNLMTNRDIVVAQVSSTALNAGPIIKPVPFAMFGGLSF